MYAEYLWGGVRLFLAFFAAGIGATLFSAIMTPDVISVGASGAVMGIMALLLVNVFFVCHPLHAQMDPFSLNLLS